MSLIYVSNKLFQKNLLFCRDTKTCTVLSSENDSEEEAIEKDFMEWTLDLEKGSKIETPIEKHDV